MKTPFSKKITTKLIFSPFFFLLVIFAALACGYYFLNPQNPLADFHRQHMLNLSSEKRLVVDMWFEQARKSVEYISRNGAVRDAASINTFLATATDKKKKKAADSARGAVEAASQRFLDEAVASSPFKTAVLLLKDGSVIAATSRELIGSNWSDRNFFPGAITGLKSPSVRIFYSSDSGIGFLSPVFDDKEGLVGLVYAVPDADKPAGLLNVENPVYKSEKVEMIDGDGNLILSRKGYPDKRIKYNVPKEERGNVPELRDNILFDVVPLENAPFRLVTTMDNEEVGRPLFIAMVLCAVYAGVILAVMVYKSAYSGPRLVERPVEKLVSAAKQVADGVLDNINLGKEYGGELLELRNAFESMVDELKTREAILSERVKCETVKVACSPYVDISHEFTGPLASMAAAADVMVRDRHQLGEEGRKALDEILRFSKSLLLYMDNLYDFAQFEQGRLARVNEQFNLCSLMNEIESYAKGLTGTREIEVIVDCQEEFENRMVQTDRLLLKKILMNLADNAVTNTAAGTITILTGTKSEDGTEYIEISVADTGKGFSDDELNGLVGDGSCVRSPAGLCIARNMSEILGGRLTAESIAGKGSVFTLTVPVTSISEVATAESRPE